MKITLVGPVYPYRGGIAHYTTVLAQRMVLAGHDVDVISFHRQYPAWLYPGKTDRDPSLQPISVPAQYMLDSINPLTWLKTARTVTNRQPDLVLIMWWSTFWAPADFCLVHLLKQQGLRVAYLIHNVLPHEARFFDRWLGRLGLSAVNDFVVQTRQQRDLLCSLIRSPRIVETTHPIYDMFVNQRIDRAEARSRLGIAEDTQAVLLFFGIVRPYKGLRYLLEAVQRLAQSGRKVKLIVAGEFWEPEVEYVELLDRLGIAGSVLIFNRYIENEDVPLFFSAADLFVAPYTGGTQSGAVNIALSFQLPIVMTETIAESVQAEIRPACQVVPSGDAAALATAIEAQIAAPTGDQGTHDYVEKSWTRLISDVEGLLHG